jgi:hypothetical protein
MNDNSDREPQPTDGPEYHADHAAWRQRREAEAEEALRREAAACEADER